MKCCEGQEVLLEAVALSYFSKRIRLRWKKPAELNWQYTGTGSTAWERKLVVKNRRVT